jgi:hypothetical protein
VRPTQPARRGLRFALGPIIAIGVPVLVVAAVLAVALSVNVDRYHGNLLGLVQFGKQYTAVTHPPAGAPVDSPAGFDGQYFYLQALDPLLLHDSTVDGLRPLNMGYRLQRAGYPALAWALAAGQRSAIPFGLLAVNVLVLLAIAGGFAVYAYRRGWSTLLAIPLALMPGLLLPTLRDLSDPLATAALLAGVLLWYHGRRWPAAAALTVAVLTREVMLIAVAAIAVEAAVRAWRARSSAGSGAGTWRPIVSSAWPVVVVPTVCFFLWQAYITIRFGGLVGSAGLHPPFVNLVDELRASLHNSDKLLAGFDVLYVALILAACAAAFVSVRRRLTITSAAVCAVAISVLLPTMGDVWSDTRDTAPLFALLLVDGLHRRNRSSVVICLAAAAMTLLIPLAVPGSF